jgi:3-methyladenine DNA glycosylase AlkD
MDCSQIIKELKSHSNPKNVAGMARFGISTNGTLGVSVPALRAMAKRIGKNHELALELWESGIHEARMLAGFVDDAELVSGGQMEKWVIGFDSWDVCDQVCGDLFDRTEFAHAKAAEWSKRKEEFVKRAGFALMAALAVHDKKASDAQFEKFFVHIKREANDERNFVRKAVNWALRNIGKRNERLRVNALGVAREIAKMESKSARWIAADAIRELESEAVKARVGRKGA